MAMWDADPVKTEHDLGIGPNDDFIKDQTSVVPRVPVALGCLLVWSSTCLEKTIRGPLLGKWR